MLVLLAMPSTWAQPAPEPPKPLPVHWQMLTESELVLVGTVQATVVVNPPGLEPFGEATVHVDRMLLGSPLTTLVLRYQLPELPSAEKEKEKEKVPPVAGFTVGKQYLLFIKHAAFGYYTTFGPMGIVDPQEADAYAQALRAIPLTLRILPVRIPLYFDRQATIEVAVTNNAPQAVGVTTISVSGMLFSPRMGNIQPFTVIMPPVVGENTGTAGELLTERRAQRVKPVVTLVPPGQTQTVKIDIMPLRPDSWALLTPDTYFLTPVALYAQCTVTLPQNFPLAPGVQINVHAAPITALTGYSMANAIQDAPRK